MSLFVKQNGQWTAKSEVNENASTNDQLLSLGYEHNQFYSYTNYNMPHDYDKNADNILSVCLKVMTEDIICVMANDGRKSLTDAEVSNYMRDFDFKFEYSLYSMESDLDSAIAERNFSIQFVADALGIPYSPNDKILHSSRFNYDFFFERGYLTGYKISDSYNREAHEMKDSIPWMYKAIESHAFNFHGANTDAGVNEINIQAHAYYNLPGGVRNQFLEEFKNTDGSYNYKMLLVAKYKDTEYEQGINYEDCKCICHQELKFEQKAEEGLDKVLIYRYRDYTLTFDEKGQFLSCGQGKQNINAVKATVKRGSSEDCHNALFGVDINSEPNGQWDYEGMFDGKNKHYIFVKSSLQDEFFNECKVLAFEGGGANFLWQPIPYDALTPYKIALRIEHEIKGNRNLTLEQCIEQYKDSPSSSSIDIESGDLKFSINYGFEKENITMTLWTSINKDEMIKKAKEEHPDRIIADPDKAEDISKEDFLANFFGVDIYNAPDRTWTYQGFVNDSNPHHVLTNNNLNDDTFSTCVLLSLTNGGCLFSWSGAPMGELNYMKVACRIHQNLLGEKDCCLADCLTKYLDVILGTQNAIEITDGDMKITIELNNAEGTFSMYLWTMMDKTELINKLKG